MAPVPRRSVRTLVTALLALAALPSGGCDDERGDPVQPDGGFLDGDGMFGAAVVSTEAFRMINHFVEAALDRYEGGGSLPVIEPACLGTGFARIDDNDDADPRTFDITFDNHVVECDAIPLTLNTDPALDAKILITFLETSPGLVFEVELPWDGFPLFRPRGFSAQLPTDQGGFILSFSTPNGPLLCELDGSRDGLGGEGIVHIEGTVRIEDRAQGLLIVEELALQFEYDDDIIPKFADWPGGSYEIAGLGGGGGIGFGGGTPGYPFDVFFDGLGGVAFPVGDRTCVANMVTGENPCEDL